MRRDPQHMNNPGETYASIHAIVEASAAECSAWQGLIEFIDTCDELDGVDTKQSQDTLRSVNIVEDVSSVREQIRACLDSETPPPDLDVFLFGLFEWAESDRCGYYLAGVHGFDPMNGDTLCDPVYWPAERYLESRALDAVKLAERAAHRDNRDREGSFVGDPLLLGAASVVSRFAMAGLGHDQRIVTAHDAGEEFFVFA